MSARDKLFDFIIPECDRDELLHEILAEHRAEVLREAAEEIVAETRRATCEWRPDMPDAWRQLHRDVASLAEHIRKTADNP